MLSSEVPSASAALKPKMRLAPWFQNRIKPSASESTTASGMLASRAAAKLSGPSGMVDLSVLQPCGGHRQGHSDRVGALLPGPGDDCVVHRGAAVRLVQGPEDWGKKHVSSINLS